MVRVCPHSDSQCPDGMGCGYSCATSEYDGIKRPTQPMTPREKVARMVSPKCWEFYDRHAADPRMKAEINHEVAPSLQLAGHILAALASGSGDHAELARLADAAAKRAPGLWGSDVEKGEGEYGSGDDDRTGFMVPYMETEHGKRLFDAHYCDVAEVHEDYDSDDDGGCSLYAWDQASKEIFDFLSAVQPSAVLALIAEIAALRAEIEEARTIDSGLWKWLGQRDLQPDGPDVEWSDIVVALTEHETNAYDIADKATDRATEAERKLAEARGWIEKLDCECDPAWSTRQCGRCTFLSSTEAAS
jgi:hypothetical protein